MRYVLNYITWLAEFAPRIHGASTGVVRRVATSGLAVSRAAVPQGMASLSGRVGTPHYCPYRNIGKCSPVHFFWGSFVLAVTRFSGRPAPEHPGGVPHLADWEGRDAYSHEVSSAGFWPGNAAIAYPAFYA